MKMPESGNTIERYGATEEAQFTIEGSAKAFSILSDKIYQNKVQAVIRELSTNAYDAHIEAGIADQPFDVHLPTVLEPWFELRDFGLGMSDDTCMRLYTTYFESTKTESNDFVGALGIGSKVGFAYSDSFMVTSIHDDTKTVYTAYKDEDNCPVFSKLHQEETDEPSGLSVKIEVDSSDHYEFKKEAVRVYRFFDVTPNINIPEVSKEVAEKKNPEYAYSSENFGYIAGGDRYNTETFAIMGCVAYEIPRQAIPDSLRKESFHLFFDIGDLSFLPGREKLEMSKATQKALKEKLESMLDVLIEQVKEKYESAKSLFEARLISRSNRDAGGLIGSLDNHMKEWNGQEIWPAGYNYIKLPYRLYFVAPDFEKGDNTPRGCKSWVEIKKYAWNRRQATVSRGQIVEGTTVYFSPNVEFYALGRTGVSRIRHRVLESGLDKVTAYAVDPEDVELVAEAWGFDPSEIKSTDTLPKPPVKQRSKSVRKSKVYVAGGGANGWNEEEREFDQGGVYVTIFRGRILETWRDGYDFSRELDVLTSLGIDTKNIFAVKKAATEMQSWEKDAEKWEKYSEWLEKKLSNWNKNQEIPVNDISSNGLDTEVLKQVSDIAQVQEFTKVVDVIVKQRPLLENIYEVQRIFDRYDLKMTRTKKMQTAWEGVLDVCPMLRVADCDELNNQPELFANYVKQQYGAKHASKFHC